jgi:nicotinate-nucleotide adenylyltransferase
LASPEISRIAIFGLKMKVGFYGGTFDPLHFGHMNLALEIFEKKKLDEIWFCPAYLSPHKHQTPPVDSNHRIAMLRRALAPMPSFRILELEIHRQGPSYTIDTLRQLKQENSENQISLIMGDDALTEFHRWHRVEEIVELVPLLIGCRSLDVSMQHFQEHPNLLKAVRRGLVKTRMMDISSTDIRTRLQQGLYCGHLLPQEVLDYIWEFRLYF